MSKCGISTEDPQYSYVYDIQKEIQEFRGKIRRDGYLFDTHEKKVHKTLSGKTLHGDLSLFLELCMSNK